MTTSSAGTITKVKKFQGSTVSQVKRNIYDMLVYGKQHHCLCYAEKICQTLFSLILS